MAIVPNYNSKLVPLFDFKKYILLFYFVCENTIKTIATNAIKRPA
ncbi:hypothetical protein SAMN05443669_10397 [Flavobacterium xanthum]|uniref:Uncharacterized protein n=1 Tax=Flavobacterium xanthum TaxID=69322 RepID=A0A1M7J3X9_9FLAO|nr:hypothetical protein SAMN05443669_10397 [Flavobacterium xanthum]